MRAPKGQSIERDVLDEVVTPGNLQGPGRLIARGGGLPLREQQVAIPIPSKRVKQGVFGLPLLLPPLGLSEKIRGLFPFAGGVERVGLGRSIRYHSKCIADAVC